VRTAAERDEGPAEATRSRPPGVTQPLLDRDQLLDRHLALVDQLVHDGLVVELAEVGGEVERQPRPGGHDDAVASIVAIRR
jgi:hypothetical protein